MQTAKAVQNQEEEANNSQVALAVDFKNSAKKIQESQPESAKATEKKPLANSQKANITKKASSDQDGTGANYNGVQPARGRPSHNTAQSDAGSIASGKSGISQEGPSGGKQKQVFQTTKMPPGGATGKGNGTSDPGAAEEAPLASGPLCQFKCDLPKSKGETAKEMILSMKHQFTELKFDRDTLRPDFSGKIATADADFVDEPLNYDYLKQDLVLDRVSDVTREIVSFRDSMVSLKVHTMKKYFPEQVVEIEGLPAIIEKPSITRANYNKVPGYTEWRTLIEDINKPPPAPKKPQNLKAATTTTTVQIVNATGTSATNASASMAAAGGKASSIENIGLQKIQENSTEQQKTKKALQEGPQAGNPKEKASAILEKGVSSNKSDANQIQKVHQQNLVGSKRQAENELSINAAEEIKYKKDEKSAHIDEMNLTQKRQKLSTAVGESSKVHQDAPDLQHTHEINESGSALIASGANEIIRKHDKTEKPLSKEAHLQQQIDNTKIGGAAYPNGPAQQKTQQAAEVFPRGQKLCREDGDGQAQQHLEVSMAPQQVNRDGKAENASNYEILTAQMPNVQQQAYGQQVIYVQQQHQPSSMAQVLPNYYPSQSNHAHQSTQQQEGIYPSTQNTVSQQQQQQQPGTTQVIIAGTNGELLQATSYQTGPNPPSNNTAAALQGGQVIIQPIYQQQSSNNNGTTICGYVQSAGQPAQLSLGQGNNASTVTAAGQYQQTNNSPAGQQTQVLVPSNYALSNQGQVQQQQSAIATTTAVLVQTNQGPMYMATTPINSQQPQGGTTVIYQEAAQPISQASSTSSGQIYQIVATASGQQVLIPISGSPQAIAQTSQGMPATIVQTTSLAQDGSYYPFNVPSSNQQIAINGVQRPSMIRDVIDKMGVEYPNQGDGDAAQYGVIIQGTTANGTQIPSNTVAIAVTQAPNNQQPTQQIMMPSNQLQIAAGQQQQQQQQQQQPITLTYVYDPQSQSYIQVQTQPHQITESIQQIGQSQQSSSMYSQNKAQPASRVRLVENAPPPVAAPQPPSYPTAANHYQQPANHRRIVNESLESQRAAALTQSQNLYEQEVLRNKILQQQKQTRQQLHQEFLQAQHGVHRLDSDRPQLPQHSQKMDLLQQRQQQPSQQKSFMENNSYAQKNRNGFENETIYSIIEGGHGAAASIEDTHANFYAMQAQSAQREQQKMAQEQQSTQQVRQGQQQPKDVFMVPTTTNTNQGNNNTIHSQGTNGHKHGVATTICNHCHKSKVIQQPQPTGSSQQSRSYASNNEFNVPYANQRASSQQYQQTSITQKQGAEAQNSRRLDIFEATNKQVSDVLFPSNALPQSVAGGSQTQIVFQPFQVIKGNVYQTQVTAPTTNGGGPGGSLQHQHGIIAQTIEPIENSFPHQQQQQYKETNQRHHLFEDYSRTSLQSSQQQQQPKAEVVYPSVPLPAQAGTSHGATLHKPRLPTPTGAANEIKSQKFQTMMEAPMEILRGIEFDDSQGGRNFMRNSAQQEPNNNKQQNISQQVNSTAYRINDENGGTQIILLETESQHQERANMQGQQQQYYQQKEQYPNDQQYYQDQYGRTMAVQQQPMGIERLGTTYVVRQEDQNEVYIAQSGNHHEHGIIAKQQSDEELNQQLAELKMSFKQELLTKAGGFQQGKQIAPGQDILSVPARIATFLNNNEAVVFSGEPTKIFTTGGADQQVVQLIDENGQQYHAQQVYAQQQHDEHTSYQQQQQQQQQQYMQQQQQLYDQELLQMRQQFYEHTRNSQQQQQFH